MTGLRPFIVWTLFLLFADAGSMDLAKRMVLSNLSGGFCRSWKFGVVIVNDILYMVGLDGGLVPDDYDASNNYLMTLDLTSSFSTTDGSKYQLSKIDSSVPKVKNQALWSNPSNTTLYMYGGRYVSNTSADDGIWTYTVQDESWQLQQGSIRPTRLVYGADTNAPDIQAAYWVGGYQDSDTTVTITDSTEVFSTEMIQLNTTTGEYTSLDPPFPAVQEGSLSYLPVGELGILVYIGGEVPSIPDGVNVTLTSNSWNYVQVYDIAAAKWYNQSTTGTATPRTQFCASVQYDSSSSTYQIYVLGGADLQLEDTITDVNYLSIPSFKWFSAAPLSEPRMSLACATYGRQIFGVGGRLAWANGAGAGCYDMPAFIYDAQSETTRSEFDPSLTSYSLSSSTSSEIKQSPYPSSWANPALKTLFVPSNNTTTNSTTTNSTATNSTTPPTSNENTSGTVNKGAIAGGVVGGVAGLALIIGLLWFIISRQKRRKQSDAGTPSQDGQQPFTARELPPPEVPAELSSESSMYTELPGTSVRRAELEGGQGDRD